MLSGFSLDWRFAPVFEHLDPANAYVGSYDFGLVATSVLIAILAAFVALSISGRIAAVTTQRARWAWTCAGAISMGGGIWSMHFIGMLAFSLPCGIAYNPFGTLLSSLPGVLASGIALWAISKPSEPNWKRLTVSAVLMGAGIGAMHYSGMAAMKPEALLRYDTGLVGVSVVVAVVLSFVSLSIRFHRPMQTGLSATTVAATVMGCAVAGMHYTAMQASVFYPLPGAPATSMALSPTLLALLITIFTVLIAASTLVATFAGRQNELALSLTAEIARRKDTEEDLLRARIAAEEASNAKSQFLATMSHEIRTPMNGVLGMANLLASTPLNDRQRRLVDNLARSGRALLATINDILDLSKIEAGRFELFDVDFDPRDLLAEVTDLFCEPCASKGIELIYFVAEDVPAKLRGDPVRLRQVLINLVGNGVKFTERGEILIDVKVSQQDRDQTVLVFSVIDTGLGIAADQQTRIFESFYQADGAMTRARGGSGLGLAIVKRLVGLMDGEVGVESALGAGSRFWFTARLTASKDQPANRIVRRMPQALRALLVDANAVSAEVLLNYLSGWGIETAVYTNLAGAEEAWAAEPSRYDVVVIDIKGFGDASLQFTSKVQPVTRVIALVSIDGLLADNRIEKLGVYATLAKPVRPSELYNSLVSMASDGRQHGQPSSFGRRTVTVKSKQFNAHVLVVEDNAVNQEVAVGMLEAMGCRTSLAANGERAIALFRTRRFDLILMDCEMPVMDGFAAAGHIRDMERASPAEVLRTPIVAVTAHALPAIREKCLAAGMDDFVVKPFDERLLNHTLEHWLPKTARTSTKPTDSGLPIIDQTVTAEIEAIDGGGKTGLLRRVLLQFLATAPPLVADIREKSRADDAEGVRLAAHSLKSSAAAIGAKRLSNRCAEIEAIVQERGASAVGNLLDLLDTELAVATQSVQALT